MRRYLLIDRFLSEDIGCAPSNARSALPDLAALRHHSGWLTTADCSVHFSCRPTQQWPARLRLPGYAYAYRRLTPQWSWACQSCRVLREPACAHPIRSPAVEGYALYLHWRL